MIECEFISPTMKYVLLVRIIFKNDFCSFLQSSAMNVITTCEKPKHSKYNIVIQEYSLCE